MNRTRACVVALVMSAAAVGCVTINIYFPEAAAERAADRIIDDVWQEQGASRSGGAGQTDGDAR